MCSITFTSDINQIITELIVSDTIIIENIIERRLKSLKGKTKQEIELVNTEIELLNSLKNHLEKGSALNLAIVRKIISIFKENEC